MGYNKMKKVRILIYSIPFIFFSPALAYANAGTAFMWAVGFHLLIGNLFIGVLEGYLLSRIFKARLKYSISIMIAANYFSMIAGIFLIDWLKNFTILHIPQAILFYHIPALLIAIYVLFLIVTVFLEWPFCFWTMGKMDRRKTKSLIASLVIQAISYCLLVPFYMSASQISLVTKVKIDNPASFASMKAWVYFISLKDDNVYKIRTDGSSPVKIMEIGEQDKIEYLYVRPGEESGTWDLWGYTFVPGRKMLLIRNFSTHAALTSYEQKTIERGEPLPDPVNFMATTDLRLTAEKNWDSISTGFWPAEGLSATNMKTGEKFQIALEAPFLFWYSRNASVIPGDQVIYQLADLIVVLDLNKKKIGLITEGRGPVVTLLNKSEKKHFK